MRAPPQNKITCRIECLWPAKAILGEGLAYEACAERIWFVDLKDPHLYCYGLVDGSRRRWQLPVQVSALVIPPTDWTAPLSGETVFLCAGKHGFSWLAVDGDQVRIEPIADPEAHLPGNRFNDGKLGPCGRFYAGTMDDAEVAATGALYVLDRSSKVAEIDRGYRVPNGPAFSPDGRVVYQNDSAVRCTYFFDIANDGRIAKKRLFHVFTEDDGYPDGMTTDADGNLWIAMWDGRKIQRVDPVGNLSGFISTPVTRPTNCLFVGDCRLVFTSASIGLPKKSDLDGGLFIAHCEQ